MPPCGDKLVKRKRDLIVKIYTLIHLQDTAITDADAMPFLTKDAAQVAMKAAWEKDLKAAGIDPAEPQHEEREWDCGENTASIRIDFNSVYETWKITEHDLDVQVAVKVYGGVVQQIIANAGISAKVYDLDVSDFPDEEEQEIAIAKEAEYKNLQKDAGWEKVW